METILATMADQLGQMLVILGAAPLGASASQMKRRPA